MMKHCTCRGRERNHRVHREAIRDVTTQVVLVERKADTLLHKGSRAATQVVLIDRNQKRRGRSKRSRCRLSSDQRTCTRKMSEG